jgi:hypothetical protein
LLQQQIPPAQHSDQLNEIIRQQQSKICNIDIEKETLLNLIMEQQATIGLAEQINELHSQSQEELKQSAWSIYIKKKK